MGLHIAWFNAKLGLFMIFSSGSVLLRPYFVAPGPRVDQQRLVRRSRLRWPQVRVEVANLFRKDELPCEDPPMGRPSRLWYLSPFGNLSPKKYLFHLGATETLGTGKRCFMSSGLLAPSCLRTYFQSHFVLRIYLLQDLCE